MRNVQISQELFMQLLRFHLIEDESCEKEIKKELEKKLDKMVMRDLFGKSKTAPTEEERERARKEYLDRRELTKAEEKTLIWLAGWEESTVDNLLSVIEKQPGYGQRKRADTPINLSMSPRSNRILLNKNKPSAFESEIHPSHKLRLCSAYFAPGEQAADRRISS